MNISIDNKHSELNVELTFCPKAQNYDGLKILAKIISHLIAKKEAQNSTKQKSFKNSLIERGKKYV